MKSQTQTDKTSSNNIKKLEHHLQKSRGSLAYFSGVHPIHFRMPSCGTVALRQIRWNLAINWRFR